MTRLALFLLLFLPQGPPLSAPVVVSPQKTPAANRALLQDAHDAAAAKVAGTTRRATVHVPPGDYRVDGPIFSDASCVRWLGDGRGGAQSSVIRGADGYAGPIFVTGLPRGTPPDSSYRPDLFGKLDKSAASKPGQRAGVRTRGDLYAMSQGSPLTHGGMSSGNRGSADYWQETDFLTVEAAVEGFNGGKMPLAFVGAGNGVQAPEPFVLSCGGNGTYTLFVGYQTERWGAVKVASYTFPDGGATGLVRVTCQANLQAGTVAAWVNGVQVATKGPKLPPGVRFPEPGTAPKDNVHAFHVNGQYYPAAHGSADFALYGLSVSKTLKYADLGPGSPQTPHPQLCGGLLTIPGGLTGGTFALNFGGKATPPIPANPTTDQVRRAVEAVVGAGRVAVGYDPNWRAWRLTGVGVDLSGTPGCGDGSGLTGCLVSDAYRYFPGLAAHADGATVDPWNVAQLPFTEAPGTRHLAVAGNYTVASGSLFLLNGETGGPITSQVTFEGLEIDGGPAYGTGVMMWHSLETRFLDCNIRGGLWGVANLIFGANYQIYLRDCLLTGFDAGFLGYRATLKADTITFGNNGRWAMRLQGCNVDARHINVAASGNPQHGLVRMTSDGYGGTNTFDDVSADNEDRGYELAGFYCEAHNYGVTRLRISDAYFASMGAATPVVRLSDAAPQPNSWTWQPAIMIASGLRCDGPASASVASDGPRWSGAVRDSFLPPPVGLGTYGPSKVLHYDPTTNAVVPAVASPTQPATPGARQ